MKTAVVYFSLEGNTKYAAEKIANRLQADLIELSPNKDYPTGSVSKFVWGGKSAVLAEKPKLLPYEFNKDQYDLIILGTPIWAGTFTPPLRTFIMEQDLSGKKIALFACHSGGGSSRSFPKMQELLEHSDIVETLALFDPKAKPSQYTDNLIEEFCKKLQ